MSASDVTKPACLVVFDFDHTLIEANSDVIAIELLSSDEQKQQIYGMRHKMNWIDIMCQCFSMLKEQGLTADALLTHISKLPMNVGMRELVTQLWHQSAGASSSSDYRVELAILSDANTLFIDAILREQRILDAFGGRVHTNEVIVADGKLVALPRRADAAAAGEKCDWCGINMCKSRILRAKYLGTPDATSTSAARRFAKLVYVGDGENDCCPLRLLEERDAAFVRRGFRAEKLIGTNDRGIAAAIRAPIHYWTTGFEIRDQLERDHVLKS